MRVHYHLAPAWLARPDARTGRITKHAFGPWLAPVLGLLAGFRSLRGGPLDPFRRSADRTLERRHRAGYEQDLDRIAAALAPATFKSCVELARLPLSVRGFGPVRAAAFEAAEKRRAALLGALGTPGRGRLAAE